MQFAAETRFAGVVHLGTLHSLQTKLSQGAERLRPSSLLKSAALMAPVSLKEWKCHPSEVFSFEAQVLQGAAADSLQPL